jgi:ferredoxin
MALAQPIIFVSAMVLTAFFVLDRVNTIRYNISMGKAEKINSDFAFRLKSVLLIAFGQKKMFKRPIAALLHLAVYGAFLITQVELLEIIIDGITGKHRIVWSILHHWAPTRYLYTITINMIELASVSALIATFAFLWRRNGLKMPRFHKPEMKGWPSLDANLILVMEIILVCFIMMMNGGDQALQRMGAEHYHSTDIFIVSYPLSLYLEQFSMNTVLIIERIGWWGHILLVFFFLVYVTYSKHLHIVLAFPNTFFTRPEPKGKITNMPAIQQEVASMFDPSLAAAAAPGDEIPSFGAKDVTDLSWKSLMEAYTCTECGRCTSSCPANITGKKLSPRKIMMDTRDRMEELGEYKRQNGADSHDGKSLITDYVTKEELRACTTCNACVEECPINISPLSIIVELRRSMIMEEADSPQEWNNMFSNMENNQAPWQFAASDRLKWTEDKSLNN